MIRIRVDDFPQTKGEPKHTLAAFRDFNRELTSLIGGKRYLLGVIPKRCTVDDILFLRNEMDCVIGLHGIDHDEAMLDSFKNEFPPYLTKTEVRKRLTEAKLALETGTGRPVRIYMPPRNSIDQRTASVLDGLFDCYTTGPETEREVMSRFQNHVHSEWPLEYGRTDELLERNAHEHLMNLSDHGRCPTLSLHWTWETNIGLEHMRKFFSKIPHRYFMDFEG